MSLPAACPIMGEDGARPEVTMQWEGNEWGPDGFAAHFWCPACRRVHVFQLARTKPLDEQLAQMNEERLSQEERDRLAWCREQQSRGAWGPSPAYDAPHEEVEHDA